MAERDHWKTRLRAALEPALSALGVDVVDIERTRENGSLTLRLIVDRRGGIDLELCSEASRIADPLIDSLGLTDHDFFEVSSPGLDRPLRGDRDLARHVGKAAEVTLYRAENGQKRFCGILQTALPGRVAVRLDDGTDRDFAAEDVAKVKRTIRWG